MKKLLLPAMALWLSASAVPAGNWFGSGPWANSTYYPGNLDGKYQAAVFGANISGVLGFALRDGAPTTTVTSQLNTTNNSSQSTLTVDPFQNYFVIFVEGRTYSGLTTAAINYNNNTVTGGLLGTQPDVAFLTNGTNFVISSQLITNVTVSGGLTNITVDTLLVTNRQPALTMDPAVLVNRGLNGGYQANINSKKSVFTFGGNGQLSTPAQAQTVNFTKDADGNIIGAQIQTSTVPFQLNGIRVSFSSASSSASTNSLAQ